MLLPKSTNSRHLASLLINGGGAHMGGATVQEQEQSGEASRMRTLSGKDLLIQLPYLQRLLQRLVDCRPGGPCVHDEVVQVSTCSDKSDVVDASPDDDPLFPRPTLCTIA